MERKIILVDMDGTISDSEWRNKFAPKWGGSWEEFHEKCYLDKPLPALNIVRELSAEYNIIIATARPYYVEQETVDWLVKNDLKVFNVMMRRSSEYGMSSVNLKLKFLNTLRDTKWNICFAIDDREDVCAMYEANGVPTFLVGNKKLPEVTDAASKTPDQLLKAAADLFKSRDKVYGDSYKKFGPVMKGLFPGGIKLETEADFQRFSIMVMIAAKIHRYSLNFDKGHRDSLDDLSVYSMMLQHIDQEML